MYAQLLVKFIREQRECSTCARTQDSAGGKCRCRISQVRIDQIICETHIEQHHAEAEKDTGTDTDQPIGAGVVGPGKPEETDRQDDSTEHGGRKTSFRWCGTIVAGDDTGVSLLVDKCDVEEG